MRDNAFNNLLAAWCAVWLFQLGGVHSMSHIRPQCSPVQPVHAWLMEAVWELAVPSLGVINSTNYGIWMSCFREIEIFGEKVKTNWPTLFLFQTQWLKRSRKLDLVVPPAFPIGGMDAGGLPDLSMPKLASKQQKAKENWLAWILGASTTFGQLPRCLMIPSNQVLFQWIW